MSKSMPVPAKCAHLPSRSILRLSGADRYAFLQGLVSQDVTAVLEGKPIFTAYLTPQGKYLADFFVLPGKDDLLIDCEAEQAADLVKRFMFFKTRADIRVDDARGQFAIFAFWDGEAKEPQLYSDPRLARLGSRLVIKKGERPLPDATHDESDYREWRYRNGVPEGVHEIEVGQTILLEANFDKLNGVSFKKGCYMGQELTARTHYRALIKKRYLPFKFEGVPPTRHDDILHRGFGIGKIQIVGNDYGLGLFHLEKVRPFVEDATPLIHDGMSFNIFLPPYLDKSIFHSTNAQE